MLIVYLGYNTPKTITKVAYDCTQKTRAKNTRRR